MQRAPSLAVAGDRLDSALIDRALEAARSVERFLQWYRNRVQQAVSLRGAAERALVVAAADAWFGEPRVRFGAIYDRASGLLATTDAHALAQAERFLPGSLRMNRACAPFEVLALDRRAAERWIIRVPLVCTGASAAATWCGELWLGAVGSDSAGRACAPAAQLELV